jgi:hypothetical protein
MSANDPHARPLTPPEISGDRPRREAHPLPPRRRQSPPGNRRTSSRREDHTPPERIVVTLDQDGKVVESRSGELPEGASSSSRSETTSISETRCRLHRNRATETPHPPGRTSERGASSM